MAKYSSSLPGKGLMQSQAEWDARGDSLAASLSELLLAHIGSDPVRGLDIGCQQGELTDRLQVATGLQWFGIDPIISQESRTGRGCVLGPGRADQITFPDGHIDCALFANVFEHIAPATRQASLDEIARILRPGGIVVGQVPNPFFPIESHSRLPMMGFLPRSIQKRYWARFTRVPWDRDFFVVTLRQLRKNAAAAGLVVEAERSFNYPLDAIPERIRTLAKVGQPFFRAYPWAWQFVLRKPWRPRIAVPSCCASQCKGG